MKNAIQYYYGLYPNDVHQSNGAYQFQINEAFYYLTPYYRSMEELPELVKISTQLYQKNIFCHQFIPNIKQEIVTIINQVSYVLLRTFVISSKKITFSDIHFFSNLTITGVENSSLKRNHWKQLWMNKNDYFEYQVSQFGKQFPKIRESFSYFIGISEIGISLLNEVQTTMPLVISHRRIHPKYTLFDLYNPLNFILDYKERDLIEYWKESMLQDSLDEMDMLRFIRSMSLEENELKLLLARAFYPTFYFDRYESVIDHRLEEDILDEVINYIEQYERFLKILYLEIRSKIVLPDLFWLTKNIGI